MVGNLNEWVADWVPRSTAVPGWGGFSNDVMGFAGANTTAGPAALIRGASFSDGTDAGPLSISGGSGPDRSHFRIGFRCAR